MSERECASCGKPTPDMLCGRCVRLLELRLNDIPALVDELELTVTRQARGGSTSHRKKGDEMPLPFNASASGKRSLINLLGEWADVVAADSGAHGIPWHHTQWDTASGQVRAAVSVIQRYIAWFRVNPQAGDAAAAIWTIRNQLRSAIDRAPERLYAGPCRADLPAHVTESDGAISVNITAGTPDKCQLDLYRKWGEETITCDGHNDPSQSGGCGAAHTIEERRDFLLASLEDHLLPLRLIWEALYQLIPGCEITWETVRKWRLVRRIRTVDKRGRAHITVVPPRIAPHSLTSSGVELFRGGDVLELARDEMPRAGRRRTRHRARATA